MNATTKLNTLARDINGRYEQAAKLESQAWDHRLSTALPLEEAKKLCRANGVSFKAWIRESLNEPYGKVRELV